MKTILGVNHMWLYPEAMVNAEAHTETLKRLCANPLIDALDCWLWRGERSREEKRILLDGGKVINYNIGDRFGEDIALPSSKNASDRDRAYSLMMREIEYGLELGTKKIVFGSGPDDPTDHKGAQQRFFELIMKVTEQIPDGVELAFEPTDWDIHKRFLYGPLDETVDFIKRVRASGFSRLGLLIDMCHVPIIHETIESAIAKGGDVLNHVHLGNAVIKNPESVLYGDCHPAWSYPDSEYTEDDAVRFIKMLNDIGYLNKSGSTVSFEMRPYTDMSSEDSLKRFVSVWNRAKAGIVNR